LKKGPLLERYFPFQSTEQREWREVEGKARGETEEEKGEERRND